MANPFRMVMVETNIFLFVDMTAKILRYVKTSYRIASVTTNLTDATLSWNGLKVNLTLLTFVKSSNFA